MKTNIQGGKITSNVDFNKNSFYYKNNTLDKIGTKVDPLSIYQSFSKKMVEKSKNNVNTKTLPNHFFIKNLTKQSLINSK